MFLSLLMIQSSEKMQAGKRIKRGLREYSYGQEHDKLNFMQKSEIINFSAQYSNNIIILG